MSASEDVNVRGIGQIFITAHDLGRAVRFYRDTLGLTFLFEAGHMAFFDCGGIRLLIGTPEEDEFDHPASLIYYRVENLSAAHEALVDSEVEFLSEPHKVADMPDHELWMAFFKDTEDNVLALMSELPRPG